MLRAAMRIRPLYLIASTAALASACGGTDDRLFTGGHGEGGAGGGSGSGSSTVTSVSATGSTSAGTGAACDADEECPAGLVCNNRIDQWCRAQPIGGPGSRRRMWTIFANEVDMGRPSRSGVPSRTRCATVWHRMTMPIRTVGACYDEMGTC